MSIQARYVHTNLIAADWRALADFYIAVFGCISAPPERDYMGDALDAGTGLRGVHLCGVHLRLPGYGDDGPTLEIYNHNVLAERGFKAINAIGFGHIAFAVDDVAAARQAVLATGMVAIANEE